MPSDNNWLRNELEMLTINIVRASAQVSILRDQGVRADMNARLRVANHIRPEERSVVHDEVGW